MLPYEIKIAKLIPGETPKVKYENLKKIGRLMMIAGWIRRGTEEENYTKFDIAKKINDAFSLEEIEMLSGEE